MDQHLEPILRSLVDRPPRLVSFEECYRRVYFYCIRERPSMTARRSIFLRALERTACHLLVRLSAEKTSLRMNAVVRWDGTVLLVQDVLGYVVRDFSTIEKKQMVEAVKELFLARHDLLWGLARRLPIEVMREVFLYL